jgi:hypothetical protein
MRAPAILPSILAFLALALGSSMSQEVAREKHVEDIRAEQTPERIARSNFCKRAIDAHLSHPYLHLRQVNPETLERDVTSLYQKSDEVVLVDFLLRSAFGISPSDEDVVTYKDVRVLRSWKGAHNVGDLLTFGASNGEARCNSDVYASTITGRDDGWFLPTMGNGWHWPAVLFLRRDTSGLIDGLMLTGGEGTQGLFQVDSDLVNCFDDGCVQRSSIEVCIRASFDHLACEKRMSYPQCRDPKVDQDLIAQCTRRLDNGKEPMHLIYGRDPLLKKYQRMPVSRFLKEVQAVADSPGSFPGR